MFQIIKNDKFDNFFKNVLFCSYFSYQFFLVISVSELARSFDRLYTLLSAVIILSFLMIILCDAYYFFRGFYNFYEIAICFIVGMLLAISLYNYRNVMVIANIFAILAFKKNDAIKALKYYIIATTTAFIIIILIGIFTEYNGNVVQIRYSVERIRYGLGFYYVSVPPFYYFNIVLAYFVVYKNINILQYFAIVLINLVLFLLTDTKAPFLYTLLAIMLHIVVTKSNSIIIDKLFGFFTVISYPFFFLLSLVLSMFYDGNNPIFRIINSILTGRLVLTHNAIRLLPISLFGQDIGVYSSEKNYYIDSSFLSMLYNNGIVVLIISIVFMTYFCYLAYKKNKKSLMLALFILAARASFDFGFMALQLSPFVILFLPTLYEKNS